MLRLEYYYKNAAKVEIREERKVICLQVFYDKASYLLTYPLQLKIL